MAKNVSLPETIRIGPQTYDLIIKPNLQNDRGHSLMGQHDYEKLSITLNSDLKSKEMVADTLIHEIMHGLYNLFNLDARTSEEKVCQSISTGLIMVLKDNPELMNWLSKALKG